MDAPLFYIVRFWIDPVKGRPVLDWLDGRHIAEVVAEPGFLWARRARLAEDAADGWHAYLMIYGVESQAALDAYFAGAARQRFMEEGKPFQSIMRAERMWGTVDFRVG